MPIIVLNMGGEMIYILNQRLQAQNVPLDKARKVLGDVIRTMYTPMFLEELFKPQEIYTMASTKQIFDKLAHSSIMRLNKTSMDKLFDLMTMGVKYQLISCRSPHQYLQVTLNHLDVLAEMVKTEGVTDLIQVAISKAIELYTKLSNGNWLLLEQVLLQFFQGKKIKVSLFLQRNLQTMLGSLVLTNKGNLPFRTELPGEIRYFEGKEYIRSGDIIQFVPSQRFTRPFDQSPLDLYRALRTVNPSPYMYFLDLGGTQVVGSSPEILVRLQGGEITVRPIAGTRPRGATPEADAALEAELLADPKERAEHLMLIDLGRNDVGRVAEPGSVTVPDRFIIERYSHVMHIVSEVRGQVRPGVGFAEVIKATFPAGTVSGAPKIRALEVIRELEPVKRNIYSGAVGYLNWWGDADTAIAIRTAVIQDGRLHVQAGAGIVHDSDPGKEWDETLNKGRALFRAVAQAAGGL